jgi:mono/diheme cytochrome c family protein
VNGSKFYVSVFISAITFLIFSASKGQTEKTPVEPVRHLISEAGGSALYDSLFAGKEIYDDYCIACHGVKGDGEGVDTKELKTKPTDFTSGMYKFKSTPFGTLPTVEDIVNTLKLGVRTTAMIPQWQLNNNQMDEVAEYVLSFAPKEEKIGKPIIIPPAPEISGSLINKGKALFDKNCVSCHGKDAKGDGPSADKLVNYKGEPIHPANLTVKPLKRANTPVWIYRIINNGIEGTPMPPYFGVIKPEDIWAITEYINSIRKVDLAERNRGGMMGGMMGRGLVGEESIGMRIDMAAARAWMMRGMMNK